MNNSNDWHFLTYRVTSVVDDENLCGIANSQREFTNLRRGWSTVHPMIKLRMLVGVDGAKTIWNMILVMKTARCPISVCYDVGLTVQ